MSLCKFVKSIFFGIICEKSYYLGCYYDCKYQIWFEKTLFNSELLHPPFFYLLNFGRCRNWRMPPQLLRSVRVNLQYNFIQSMHFIHHKSSTNPSTNWPMRMSCWCENHQELSALDRKCSIRHIGCCALMINNRDFKKFMRNLLVFMKEQTV